MLSSNHNYPPSSTEPWYIVYLSDIQNKYKSKMNSMKVSVVGTKFIGKSSIISNICGLDFSAKYIASITPSWRLKKIKVLDQKCELFIWDLVAII